MTTRLDPQGVITAQSSSTVCNGFLDKGIFHGDEIDARVG